MGFRVEGLGVRGYGWGLGLGVGQSFFWREVVHGWVYVYTHETAYCVVRMSCVLRGT